MTKITPELEKVARAICIENLKATKQPTDDGTVDSYWQSFILEARAALEAIREPSEGMKNCGAYASNEQGNFEPAPAWRSMIDHILGKETGG